MNTIDVINSFEKMFIINFFIYYTFMIIINYKNISMKKIFITIILDLLIAFLYIFTIKETNQIFIIPIVYLIYTLIIKKEIKQNLNYCLFLTNISFIITYIIYFVSIIVTGILLMLFSKEPTYNNLFNILIIASIMFFIGYRISKIRRLKNGIGFLKNIESAKKIGTIINIISLIIFITFGLLYKSQNIILNYILTWIVFLIIFEIIYLFTSKITQSYKKNMKDRTIEVQKLEIEENKKEIKDIKEENLKLAEVVHRYNNRLSAIEMALEETINKNTNLEFSNELSIILNETKEISKNFAKESEIIKNTLPTTNIPGIDNMFKYMQNEAINNNIKFDLKLTDSIHDLIDNIISKDKFETMLGDHLRDAIIAVNNSKNSYKSILVTLGIVENCYELSIYDTGIEFEVNTLLKLGKERITTHKETGGSGIGFMTTFDTLRKTKGSLIIEEYDSNNSSYTKSINIRFDGKNEYRIYSYRAEKIKRQNKDKNIIVKEI